MYNSVVLSMFMKLWDLMTIGYKNSILKKNVDFFKKAIIFLFKGSIIGSIFMSDRKFIEDSLFYKIYSVLIDSINNIFAKLNKNIRKIGNTSVIYKTISNLFSNDIEALRTFFIFLFFLGFGLLGNNILRGFFTGKSYIVAFIMMIASVIGLSLKDNYKEILNNSWIFNFINSIFTIDNGGGNWW